MKWLGWACALGVVAAALGWLPFAPTDAAELVVVQTLALREADGQVTLTAPDGLCGSGADFAAAADDLAAHAPGELFFGAVEQLIVAGTPGAALADAARSNLLRPTVCVYAGEAEPTEELTALLRAHPGDVCLNDLRAALYGGGAVALPQLEEAPDGTV